MTQHGYWGYRGIVVGSSNPDIFVFDGPINPLEHHEKNLSAVKKYHKSIFQSAPQVVAKYVKRNNVKYVALRGARYVHNLKLAVNAKVLSRRGHWYLLEVEK